MKRVLVTGATGFIGQPALTALKSNDFEVHAISSRPVKADDQYIHWHQANLHDPNSVKNLLKNVRPSHLLHLAWYVEHGAFWTSTENLNWVTSTLKLVEEFALNGGQRLIALGSCAEYDWNKDFSSHSLSEINSPINPSTLYGASKAGIYTILKTFCNLKDISFAWGRLFFPYGPNESPQRLIPYTISTLLQGKVATCKQPQLQRDFIFVEDIATILGLLLQNELSGAINLGSGNPTPLADVVQLIAKLLDRENLVEYSQPDKENKDVKNILADTSRLKNELGYNKITSLDEGLQKTINWWKENH